MDALDAGLFPSPLQHLLDAGGAERPPSAEPERRLDVGVLVACTAAAYVPIDRGRGLATYRSPVLVPAFEFDPDPVFAKAYVAGLFVVGGVPDSGEAFDARADIDQRPNDGKIPEFFEVAAAAYCHQLLDFLIRERREFLDRDLGCVIGIDWARRFNVLLFDQPFVEGAEIPELFVRVSRRRTQPFVHEESPGLFGRDLFDARHP